MDQIEVTLSPGIVTMILDLLYIAIFMLCWNHLMKQMHIEVWMFGWDILNYGAIYGLAQVYRHFRKQVS